MEAQPHHKRTDCTQQHYGRSHCKTVRIRYWEASPRHRDRVFARDGWRCAVPACSSRCSRHDHHIRYRSRGGGNERGNRLTICASHHLHGIHRGAIRTWGTAPRPVFWQLGVRPGLPPLLSYVGDRIWNDDPSDAEASAAAAAVSRAGT